MRRGERFISRPGDRGLRFYHRPPDARSRLTVVGVASPTETPSMPATPCRRLTRGQRAAVPFVAGGAECTVEARYLAPKGPGGCGR
jgi:hypothetical protein